MTTITFTEDIPLKKTSFRNVEEFVYYLEAEDLYPEQIDFRMLDEDEITPDIRKAVKEAQQADQSEFFNL